MDNEKSELLECIRISLQTGEVRACEIAPLVGMTKQAFHEYTHKCKGTQIAKAEQILDAMGHEIVLRRKEKKK